MASPDGESWERVADIDVEPEIWFGIVEIAVGPAGFVAVGEYDYEAIVFHSPDGFAWSRVDDDDFRSGPNTAVWGVTAWGEGYLATGSDGVTVAAWTSADGVEWSRVDPEVFGDTKSSANSVIAGDFGLIIAGGAGPSVAEAQGAIWQSDDGLEWNRIDIAEETELGSVHSDPDGDRFLAFGTRGIWASTDGTTWDQVAGLAGISNDRPPPGVGLAWAGDTIVAGGFDMGLSLWLSNDAGLTWARIDQETPAFDGYDPQAVNVTLFGSKIVVVGEGAADYIGTEGAVWIGEFAG